MAAVSSPLAGSLIAIACDHNRLSRGCINRSVDAKPMRHLHLLADERAIAVQRVEGRKMIMSENLSAPIWAQSLATQFWGRRLIATLTRLRAHYLKWRIEQQAITHLRSMSDAQLDDIGLVRSQIEPALRVDMDPEQFRAVRLLSVR
jgi:uncharacterized protein YjiS (DUF1127 family)